MRVLIVDDDFRRHVYLKRRLVGIAGEVRSVYRASTALEALAAGERFDVLFLDYDLVLETGNPMLDVDYAEEAAANNGGVVAAWLREHAARCPQRVVVHSLNTSKRAELVAMLREIPGVVSTAEPYCWDAQYRGKVWEELAMSIAAG